MRSFQRIPRARTERILLTALLTAGVAIASIPRADATRFLRELVARGNQAVLNTFDWAFELAYLAGANRELRREVADLALRLSQLEEAEAENIRLRRLQAFEARSELTIMTGAEVIGWGDGRSSSTLTISAGSAAGVERYQAVITEAGLVGRIDQVPGRNTSIVSLLSDPANAVAAVLARTREHGIFQFVGGEARLIGIRQTADVTIGDVLLSSGRGGVYPAELRIGTISDVSADPDGLTWRVVITPSVALDRLEEVFILRR